MSLIGTNETPAKSAKKKTADEVPDAAPTTSAEKEYNEFLARLKSLLSLGQLTAQFRQNPALSAALGPEIYNGILGMLSQQSGSMLRKSYGGGTMDEIARLSGDSKDMQAAYMGMAAKAKPQIDDRYQQRLREMTGSNPLHPGHVPQWMTPQGWAATQASTPWYMQQNLVAPNTPSFSTQQLSATDRTQMDAARKDMTPAQQTRYDQMMQPGQPQPKPERGDAS